MKDKKKDYTGALSVYSDSEGVSEKQDEKVIVPVNETPETKSFETKAGTVKTTKSVIYRTSETFRNLLNAYSYVTGKSVNSIIEEALIIYLNDPAHIADKREAENMKNKRRK